MSYFPPDMPAPDPNWDDRDFWAHCSEGRLMLQSCADCNVVRHPPTPMCPRCNSTRIAWVEAPAEARVFTYTVVRHAAHPAVADRLPYVVAVVEFPESPGARLVTNLTDVNPEDVRIGMSVRLWWDEIDGGMKIHRFRPAAA